MPVEATVGPLLASWAGGALRSPPTSWARALLRAGWWWKVVSCCSPVGSTAVKLLEILIRSNKSSAARKIMGVGQQ